MWKLGPEHLHETRDSLLCLVAFVSELYNLLGELFSFSSDRGTGLLLQERIGLLGLVDVPLPAGPLALDRLCGLFCNELRPDVLIKLHVGCTEHRRSWGRRHARWHGDGCRWAPHGCGCGCWCRDCDEWAIRLCRRRRRRSRGCAEPNQWRMCQWSGGRSGNSRRWRRRRTEEGLRRRLRLCAHTHARAAAVAVAVLLALAVVGPQRW